MIEFLRSGIVRIGLGLGLSLVGILLLLPVAVDAQQPGYPLGRQMLPPQQPGFGPRSRPPMPMAPPSQYQRRMQAGGPATAIQHPAASSPASPGGAAVAAKTAGRSEEERLESVEADVSARRVAVTSSFSGREIVVFGAVHNSRQPNAAAGYYDVVILVEGAKEHLVSRKKARIGGIWINSVSVNLKDVPSYYAISSTRPLDEIASEDILTRLEIGFNHVPMRVASKGKSKVTEAELKEFREAVVRIKQASGLYQEHQYGVAFTGSSLFRASLRLPANVKVGPFATKVFLFREGKLLSDYAANLTLEREGIELTLHNFAFGSPLLYGIFAVLIAGFAGLAAAQVFGSKAH